MNARSSAWHSKESFRTLAGSPSPRFGLDQLPCQKVTCQDSDSGTHAERASGLSKIVPQRLEHFTDHGSDDRTSDQARGEHKWNGKASIRFGISGLLNIDGAKTNDCANDRADTGV